jgi:hypothetical protein
LKTGEFHFLSPFAHLHNLSTFDNFTITGMPCPLPRVLVLLDNSFPISGTEFRGGTFILDKVVGTPKAKYVIGGVPILRHTDEMRHGEVNRWYVYSVEKTRSIRTRYVFVQEW